jgi:hypothetical protein
MAADGFITDLKRKFQQGDIVLRLVYVNVAVFLAVTLVQIFLTLFNVPSSPWMNYLELPAWTEVFIRRPWTLITYMFMHAGVLHILFNMLWLFWFGRLFLAFSGHCIHNLPDVLRSAPSSWVYASPDVASLQTSRTPGLSILWHRGRSAILPQTY